MNASFKVFLIYRFKAFTGSLVVGLSLRVKQMFVVFSTSDCYNHTANFTIYENRTIPPIIRSAGSTYTRFATRTLVFFVVAYASLC